VKKIRAGTNFLGETPIVYRHVAADLNEIQAADGSDEASTRQIYKIRHRRHEMGSAARILKSLPI